MLGSSCVCVCVCVCVCDGSGYPLSSPLWRVVGECLRVCMCGSILGTRFLVDLDSCDLVKDLNKLYEPGVYKALVLVQLVKELADGQHTARITHMICSVRGTRPIHI